MRLTDKLVVQFVSPDKMVFVNDSTGQEVERQLTFAGTADLLQAITIASNARQVLDVGGVIVPNSELVGLAYALGYFARSAAE